MVSMLLQLKIVKEFIYFTFLKALSNVLSLVKFLILSTSIEIILLNDDPKLAIE